MKRKTIRKRVKLGIRLQHDSKTNGRLSLAETAYREMKRRILDNDISPGTALLEEELAALLGMSRTPVHEAAIRLAEEGLVEVRPRHGMRILPISANDTAQIYQIITALESEAAELIALQGVPPAEIEALRKAVSDMDLALNDDDLTRWAHADETFHRRLLENCPNSRLVNLIFQFWEQTHRVRMVTLKMRPKPSSSNRDHRALVKAIEKMDSIRAREIHHAHRVKHGKMLVDLLQKHRLRMV